MVKPTNTMSTMTNSDDSSSSSDSTDMDWPPNDSGSPSDKSSSSGNSSSQNASSVDKEEQLAQAETKAVFQLRVLVILILFLAASGVSVFVYVLTSNAEEYEYRAQYEGSAKIVLDKFINILDEQLGAISTVSVATIAHSIDHFQGWPFITLSFIQQRFSKTNQIAGSLYLEFNPLVTNENKEAWENFTDNPEHRHWIPNGLEYQEKMGLNVFDEMTADDPLNEELVGTHNLTYDTDEGEVVSETGDGPFLAVWQTSPVLRQGLVNKNRYRDPVFTKWANLTMDTQQVVIGGMDRLPPGYASDTNRKTRFYATILSMNRRERTMYLGDPVTDIFIPVFDSFDEDRKSVGVLRAVFHWQSYFRNILPDNVPDLYLVLDNACDGSFTYLLMGDAISPYGDGDLHDKKFDHMKRNASFDGFENIGDGTVPGLRLNQDDCPYSLRVYPTQDYYKEYHTATPKIMTLSVAIIFIFTTFMFLLYDRLVERRQRLVLRQANQSNAIVSSLFPKNVRDRLLNDRTEDDKRRTFITPNHRLRNFLGGDDVEEHDGDTAQAIADLFPNCTVLFADIVGFTAWSSARDPSQVFELLQTIYQAFDVVAKKRRVFKVETIGDCYVAVAGLPEPQVDHAVIMAKFAGECRTKLGMITRSLEVKLGPDTGELEMRFGLHSGPVTAGVLRGDRSRFQLFGDTVNTAARMESTGESNKIQVSQATANLLMAAQKSHWVEPRLDAVQAKGKGILRTFWLNPHARKGSTSSQSNTNDQEQARKPTQPQHGDITMEGNQLPRLTDSQSAKEGRLIDWVVGIFEENLKRVIVRSRALNRKQRQTTGPNGPANTALYEPKNGQIPLDEVEDKMTLTKFDVKVALKESPVSCVELDDDVRAQLRDYVTEIASLYRRNPFHNFEHACHVTMSVVKLLKRIVTPDLDVFKFKSSDLASQLHHYTYGITSDPLATLAIIFSALIHDVDHRGVSNVQLGKEEPEMANMYRQKSIAEQNSLDIAWDALMRHRYSDLRQCMFANQEELEHFRQVAVNVVLATDIFDKELNELRKNRWNRAFADRYETSMEDSDLKATIVIEHIIQASDISHTMQHWHIYRRWNECLFKELALAYRSGRMPDDPATFWYQSELNFFDNYIIPLTKKLKDCGVFGVSSDEYLNYALMNREEWKVKGQDIVKQLGIESSIKTEIV